MYDNFHLSINVVAFVLLQLRYSDKESRDCIQRFLTSYASDWPRNPGAMARETDIGLLQTFSIRYFSVGSVKLESKDGKFGSLYCIRESGILKEQKGRNSIHLQERRISLALNSEYYTRPCFLIVLLGEGLEDIELPYIREKMKETKQDSFAGVLQFYFTIAHAVDIACESWEEVMDELDAKLQVTVSHKLSIGL
jgi:hypothetical protein